MLSANGAVITDSSEYNDGVSGRRVSSLNGVVLVGKAGVREKSISDDGRRRCSDANRLRLGGEAVDLDLELENLEWW